MSGEGAPPVAPRLSLHMRRANSGQETRKTPFIPGAGISGVSFKPTPVAEPLDKSVLKDELGLLNVGDRTYRVAREDFIEMGELGSGAFGVVKKAQHVPSDTFMAVKHIRDSMQLSEREKLLTEISVIKKAKSKYIVHYYGVNFWEGSLELYMEVMAFDVAKMITKASERKTHIPEEVLGCVCVCVCEGLEYLKRDIRVMHRDVKPSNILVGLDGSVKLCDFGISKIMQQSMLNSNVGSEMYLAPERLDPRTSSLPYDVRSEVWSLGLSLCECALLSYPYLEGKTKDVFALMQAVVEGPPPRVPLSLYSPCFSSFVSLCLQKDRTHRPKYRSPAEACPSHPALMEHEFFLRHKDQNANITEWWASVNL